MPLSWLQELPLRVPDPTGFELIGVFCGMFAPWQQESKTPALQIDRVRITRMLRRGLPSFGLGVLDCCDAAEPGDEIAAMRAAGFLFARRDGIRTAAWFEGEPSAPLKTEVTW